MCRTEVFDTAKVRGSEFPRKVKPVARQNCLTIGNLIGTAYILYGDGNRVRTNPNIPLIPIEGGPAWINSDRYSIKANA